MSDKPVCILGCGPAGLFAAQAVAECGGMPLIFSVKKKSEILGAQYLHRAIPGICGVQPEGEIRVKKLGSAASYAQRVYGDPEAPVSFHTVHNAPIWSLRDAYERAWELWEPQIIEVPPMDYEEVQDMTARFPVVISTIPKWTICGKPKEHAFKSVRIHVSDRFEYTGLKTWIGSRDNIMVYNGTAQGDWYRTSRIFGHDSSEYAGLHPRPGFHDKHFKGGFKVVGNDCDCHPNVVFAGRMGKWERGVLTHHAFESAVSAFMERMAV